MTVKRVQNTWKTSAEKTLPRVITMQPSNRTNKNRIKNNKQDPVLSLNQ